jgi:hypothetical protein
VYIYAAPGYSICIVTGPSVYIYALVYEAIYVYIYAAPGYSICIVTGPSLLNSTSILAPNFPSFTFEESPISRPTSSMKFCVFLVA